MSVLARSTPLLASLARAVEALTPLSLAASWDNVGLLLQAPFPRQPTGPSRILCCIDLTESVATEALSHPSTCAILVYHPTIFSGLKALTLDNPLQSSLLRCAAQGVHVYAIHTAADNAVGGVNDHLAAALFPEGVDLDVAARSVLPIVGERNPPAGQEGSGTGRRVQLPQGESLETLIACIKSRLSLSHLQLARAAHGPSSISSIAICAGSGASVLKDVVADLYLTGELSHHDILAATARGTHVLLTCHSASERPWLAGFATRLERSMNEGTSGSAYEVRCSAADKEPLVVV